MSSTRAGRGPGLQRAQSAEAAPVKLRVWGGFEAPDWPEIQFQAWRTTLKDFDGTIRLSVSYGASAIELHQDYGGFPLVADAKLREWAAMLERSTGAPTR
jgi:hypothetical protein